MTKRTKRCLLCHATFRNRERLRDHLLMEHDVLPYRQPRHVKPPKEPKPHRKIRMMVNAAMRKKADDLLSMARLIRRNKPVDGPIPVIQAATANWRRIKRENKRAMRSVQKKKRRYENIPVPLYRKDFVDGSK
jgi:hypothetical protein